MQDADGEQSCLPVAHSLITLKLIISNSYKFEQKDKWITVQITDEEEFNLIITRTHM